MTVSGKRKRCINPDERTSWFGDGVALMYLRGRFACACEVACPTSHTSVESKALVMCTADSTTVPPTERSRDLRQYLIGKKTLFIAFVWNYGLVVVETLTKRTQMRKL